MEKIQLLFNTSFLKAHFSEIVIVATVILLLIISKFIVARLAKKFNINKQLSKIVNLLIVVFVIEFFKSRFTFSPLIEKTSSFIESSLIILIFYILIVKIYIEDYLIKRKRKNIKHILIDIIKLIFVSIFVLSVLRIVFNINIITILTPSAILTAIIGLSMKDTIGNLISGLIIQMEKPFDVGDWIKIDDQVGEVVEINWRYTKLKTIDNVYLIIPNNTISSGNLLNFNKPEKPFRVLIGIGVSYETPPAKLKQAITKVLKNCTYIDQTKDINIYLKNYNDFSIDYDIAFWLKEYKYIRDAKDEIYSSLWYEFKMENIEIPFPIRTIIHKAKDTKEENISEEIIEQLQKTELFKNVPKSILSNLIKFSNVTQVPAGAILIKENDNGDSMYVVLNGVLDVIKGSKKIAELKKGSIVGEMGLLTGKKRTATVIAKTDCDLLEITRPVFKIFLTNTSLYNNIKEIFNKRSKELENYSEKSREKEYSTSPLFKRFKELFNV